MTVNRVTPDLSVADIAVSTAFYRDLVGLRTAMDQGWVAILANPDQPRVQILLQTADQTAPVNPALSIEVDDVDAAYAAALELNAEIVHPLTDEGWGVRRFFVRDPDGHVVNVLGHR